jgi:hypothetical protein
MRFGKIGTGLAGLVVAGASLLGNAKEVRATPISNIESQITYGDFNSDGQQDARVTYNISNNLDNGVSPYTDLVSWSLDAGKNYGLDDSNVSFDLPSGWSYSVGDIQTTFSANSSSDYIGNLSSLDFQVTSFGSTSIDSTSARAYNGLGNNLEENFVDTLNYFPEPSVLTLLGLGGVGVLGKRRTLK